MAKKTTSKEKSLPGFEESLAELEKTVRDLEQGDLGLEESLAHYENGVKLLRHCHGLLSKAQRRIELLTEVDAQGNAVTEPMTEEQGDTLEEKAQRRSQRRTAAKRPKKPDPLGEEEGSGPSPDDVDEPGRLF